MGDLFNFKEIIKKNDGKATLTIVIVVVLAILATVGSTPKENDTSLNEEPLISNVEDVQSEEENEVLEDSTVNDQLSDEENEIDINDEVPNIEIDNSIDIKENEVDLNKLKDKELAKIQAYSGNPYCVVNNNVPFFYDKDLRTSSYEKYSSLDYLR